MSTLNRAKIQPFLSVVMPVFNERATIAEIISRVSSVGIDKELIIVDDCSTDGTREFLMDLRKSFSRKGSALPIKFAFHERNRGKGAALRTGFAQVTGSIVVIQDADLELDPQEYRQLVEPIQTGYADVVYGSRFLGKERGEVPAAHFWGNRLLTAASNLCTGLNLTDVWTCYKTFRREVLDGMRLQEDRFAFEPEFTAKVAARGWRVAEIPIGYMCRSEEDGKKISWKDGFRGLACTVYYSVSARLSFSGQVRPAVAVRN